MTRFISNDDLWREIKNRVVRAKHVNAAVAYLGGNGAKLLPLKRDHKLVVDMSLGAVRQGVTNPHEVRKLIGHGVRVFSRGSLHAKFLLIDKTLIASSANVSRNSNEILDEAGIITTDPAAVRQATDFFDKLCTEPVGKEYLKKCIGEYRPPQFKPAIERGRYVGPPSRVLSLDEWVSDRGKRYTMLMLETPSDGESMSLTDFRKKIVAVQPELNRPNPRTKAITDNDRADSILRLWTVTGKIAKNR